MNATTELPRIPLASLHLSQHNARKTKASNIEQLAASIAAHGLLQNLTVTANAKPGDFEVVAGGRRLAAMQMLQREGRLPANLAAEGVPCLIITDADVAHEASAAENTLREAMHPADQFDAFKRMVDDGSAIPDIAGRFGVSELFVRQRLKLAKVHPKLFQIYRDGGMSLEQLQALALTDDQKEQERVWFKPKYDHERSAWNIRQTLTKQETRSDGPVARFVGLESYEAAGGPVRRDLFSTRDEAFLGDRQLLDRLAMDKLQAIVQTERDAGWSWAEAHIGMDYDKQADYPHAGVEPKRGAVSADDKKRIAAIKARQAEIEKLIDADDDAEPEAQMDHAAREALEDEDIALNSERIDLERGREIWPDEVVKKAGVLVILGDQGVLVERGRLRPGERIAKSGALEAAPTKGKAGSKEPPKKAALSQDMVQRLEMHRAAAIRQHIAMHPAIALQLLLAQLVTDLLSNVSRSGFFSLSPTNEHRGDGGLIQSKFPDVGKSPARKALDDLAAKWKSAGMPAKSSDVLPWVAKLTDAVRLELLAFLVAHTVNDCRGQQGSALAERLAIDMTKWWIPTPDTYIGVVPKALLAEAVADVAGKPAGEAILALKKDAAMADTAKHLAGKGWLPKPLRGPGYKLAKPAAAANSKPAAKKAVKAPAKKAVSKAPKKITPKKASKAKVAK